MISNRAFLTAVFSVFLIIFLWKDEVTLVFSLSFSLLFYFVFSSVVMQGRRLLLLSFSSYFLFLFLIPGYAHYMSGNYPFEWGYYQKNDVFDAALLVFLFLLSASIGYFTVGDSEGGSYVEVEEEVNKPFFYLFSLLVVLMLGSILILGGVDRYLQTRMEAYLYSNLSTIESALFFQGPRVLSFVFVVYVCVSLRTFSKLTVFQLFCFASGSALFIIFNWPAGVPRFYILGYILSFCVIAFDFNNKIYRAIYWICLVVGLLVVLPVLNFFTRDKEFFFEELFVRYLEHGDFDGFQSVINVVVFVKDEGVQYGSQLLSAIFFFVPRTIWSGKSESTGSIAAENAGYLFTHVSAPLPSEFFVDFGWPGVIIFSFVLGKVMAKLDTSRIFKGKGGGIFVAVVFGFSYIIFRGTLVGVIPPCFVAIFTAYVVFKYGFKRVEKYE
ncbi:hypothetical protein [uncultured Neptuniibacter sp.]|uniref:hypothetical protein n=1 Tax=uncultured Neptuniibacter sp. TaxID=502143 RepID=UPI0032B21497